jgi:hypothetical protein
MGAALPDRSAKFRSRQVAAGLNPTVRCRCDRLLRQEALLAAEVALSRLNADMSEQELELPEFTTRDVTQTSARAAKIVRCNVTEFGFGGKFF